MLTARLEAKVIQFSLLAYMYGSRPVGLFLSSACLACQALAY